MAQVIIEDLDQLVIERLEAIAQAHGRSLQAELKHIIEVAAQNYQTPNLPEAIDVESEPQFPDSEVLVYMEQQAHLFEQKRSELLSQYSGLYVLFENGQVLDADRNEAELVNRAYATTGPRPLFVKKVLPEDPQLSIRTPLPPRGV